MSLSSYIVSNLTSFRNPNGPEQEWVRVVRRKAANPLKVVAAEVGYIATIPFAIVETAIASIAKLFSAFLPIGRENHNKMTAWVKSSAFSIAWSSVDVAANLFCNDLIQTESGARAQGRKIFQVSVEAL